jgi:general stress protein YciG
MMTKKKPMTASEMGRKGGKARAKKYSAEQLRKWAALGGKLGGRPRKKEKCSKSSESFYSFG